MSPTIRNPEMMQSTTAFSATAISGEVVTFTTIAGVTDAATAAGTIVYGKLAFAPILGILKDRTGEFNPSTGSIGSLVFTTGVMDSALEVAFGGSPMSDDKTQKTAAALALSTAPNGSWAVDYQTGLLIVKKKTTGTTQTITSYSVATPASSGASGGGTVSAGGASYTVKRLPINISASGNIIPIVAGKKLRIISMWYIAAGAVTTTFLSNATALSGPVPNGANGGAVLQKNDDGWFETVAGQAFAVTLGSAVNISGSVNYIEI
jgi:hypothetical protein